MEVKMKYLIVVPDGSADENIEALGGKTPLEYAKTKHTDALAERGEVGMVKTIPDGMAPGSDAANLSVMGYDPAVYHTGRSPLEAASMGIEMSETDVAFRCNLVTLKGDGVYEDLIVADHSSGDISTEEAAILIDEINKKLGTDTIQFYPGVSYRHAMIVHNGSTDYNLTPPHDILERRAGDYLPKGTDADVIETLMRDSYVILSDHPVNKARTAKGLNPANSVWIWGQGRKPRLTSFFDKYKVTGITISAVDLIKGIGVCAGLPAVDVPGATGTLHTDFDGKAAAAIEQFKRGVDFIYLHVEAPDECSHQGDLEGKIKSIEMIDEKIIGPIVDYLASSGKDYRVLVVPDHQTPMRMRTHASDPVPLVFYDSKEEKPRCEGRTFCEKAGMASGIYFDNGFKLTDFFFGLSAG